MADGSHGRGDVPPFVITDGGNIHRPELPNSPAESMLAICEEPLIWRGAAIRYLSIRPRYDGTTLNDIREAGGIVVVGRVLSWNDALEWLQLDPAAMDHWGVGVLALLGV
jgi:hypothetical protein